MRKPVSLAVFLSCKGDSATVAEKDFQKNWLSWQTTLSTCESYHKAQQQTGRGNGRRVECGKVLLLTLLLSLMSYRTSQSNPQLPSTRRCFFVVFKNFPAHLFLSTDQKTLHLNCFSVFWLHWTGLTN